MEEAGEAEPVVAGEFGFEVATFGGVRARAEPLTRLGGERGESTVTVGGVCLTGDNGLTDSCLCLGGLGSRVFGGTKGTTWPLMWVGGCGRSCCGVVGGSTCMRWDTGLGCIGLVVCADSCSCPRFSNLERNDETGLIDEASVAS